MKYAALLDEATRRVLRAADPNNDKADGWTARKEKNGVQISKLKPKTSGKNQRALHAFRGMGTLTCSSPDDYIDMLLDLTERRRGWDTLFVQGRLLVELDDSTGVAWLAFGGRKCDHPRHAVLVQQRRAVGRDHMFVACSVEDVPPPDIADANQKMDVQAAGYLLRPLPNGSCEVTFVVYLDLHGLPTSVVNMLNEEIPLMVARQRAEYQTVYSVMEASITPPKPKIPPVRAKPKVDQAEESTVMPLKPFMDTASSYFTTTSVDDGEFPDQDLLNALVYVSNAINKVSSRNRTEKLQGFAELLDLTTLKLDQASSVDTSCMAWVSDGGAELCMEYLEAGKFDDEEIGRLHLHVALNVVRVEKALPMLMEKNFFDVVLRALIECSVEEIAVLIMRVLSLGSANSTVMDALVRWNAMGVIMAHTLRDERILTSILPRLLRDDRMCVAFVNEGGIQLLHGILVFEDDVPQYLAGCVAAIAVLTKFPGLNHAMVLEEDFVSSAVRVLAHSGVSTKVKIHLVRILHAFAKDPDGRPLVEPALLTLLELLEDKDVETVSLMIASLELMALLCNATSSIQQLDELGGEEFVEYVLLFLATTKMPLLNAVCGLLHVLCFGQHQAIIVEALREQHKLRPQIEIIGATLDLIAGGVKAQQQQQQKLKQQEEQAQREAEEDQDEATAAAAAAEHANEIDDEIGAAADEVAPEDDHVEPSSAPAPKEARVPAEALLQGVDDKQKMTKPELRSRGSSQYARKAAKRSHILGEIQSTERTYSTALFTFLKCIVEPLRLEESLITLVEAEHVFLNIDELYALHKAFMKELDKRCKAKSLVFGDLFLDFATKMFEPYKKFLISHADSVKYLSLKMKSEKFRQRCNELTKEIVRGGLSAENYLLLPVSRYARYALFFDQFDECTTNEDEDKSAVTEAATRMRENAEVLRKLLPIVSPRETRLLVSPRGEAPSSVDFEGDASRMSMSPGTRHPPPSSSLEGSRGSVKPLLGSRGLGRGLDGSASRISVKSEGRGRGTASDSSNQITRLTSPPTKPLLSLPTKINVSGKLSGTNSAASSPLVSRASTSAGKDEKHFIPKTVLVRATPDAIKLMKHRRNDSASVVTAATPDPSEMAAAPEQPHFVAEVPPEETTTTTGEVQVEEVNFGSEDQVDVYEGTTKTVSRAAPDRSVPEKTSSSPRQLSPRSDPDRQRAPTKPLPVFSEGRAKPLPSPRESMASGSLPDLQGSARGSGSAAGSVEGRSKPLPSPREGSSRASSPMPPAASPPPSDQDEDGGLSVTARIGIAYGVSEKVRVTKAAGDQHQYDICVGDQVIGHGNIRDKLFHFLDIDCNEVLVMRMEELAKAIRKHEQKKRTN